MKYHIEKNTVQETLVIPLFGRLVCSERFPELFSDPEAMRICDSLDYDFTEKRKKMESAAGLFYYLRTADVRRLFQAMAKHFPGGVLAFDSCNERGAKLMRKTWLKEAGITDVSAFFSLEDEAELCGWSNHFSSVTARSYMRGYRDIYEKVGLFHKLMIHFCDRLVNMKIVRIVFSG